MARKASMWAEEAGKYYRKNVGKNGIESFTDVLKSADFKMQYHAKNGKANRNRKRGGDGGEATNPVAHVTDAVANTVAPANVIQVPMENVTGVMKTGGMNVREMKMKKGKRKMTKKMSLKNKNKKKRRMTKKYMRGGAGAINELKQLSQEINNFPDDNLSDEMKTKLLEHNINAMTKTDAINYLNEMIEDNDRKNLRCFREVNHDGTNISQ